MIVALRTLVAAALLLLCQCGTDGFFEVISPVAPGGNYSSCGTSTRDRVATLEVGDPFSNSPSFRLLEEGAVVTIVRGTQGADMLVLALRVSGAGDQTCIEQRTEIFDDAGERVSYNLMARPFEAQPDGTLISTQMFFPGDYVPGPVTIDVSLGGQRLARRVEVTR